MFADITPGHEASVFQGWAAKIHAKVRMIQSWIIPAGTHARNECILYVQSPAISVGDLDAAALV